MYNHKAGIDYRGYPYLALEHIMETFKELTSKNTTYPHEVELVNRLLKELIDNKVIKVHEDLVNGQRIKY